jgi:arylsulfate sulfotransferase
MIKNSFISSIRCTLIAGTFVSLFPFTCFGEDKPPEFTVPPTISQNPNPRVPLAAIVQFSANEPVQTTLKISDGKREWERVFDHSRQPKDGLPVIGMRPNQAHHISVTIRDAAGNETQFPQALKFTTPPLPVEGNEFPPYQITVNQQDRIEPGITLLTIRRRIAGQGLTQAERQFNQGFGMLLALDAEGEVIWYYRFESRISDFEPLDNGHFVYLTQDYRLLEIDLLGNIVASWYAAGRPKGPAEGIPIETITLHHEVEVLPNGNFVVLGTERRAIDNYYTSETDPNAPRKTQNVMGDQIIEFQRDGQIVWRWNAFDHLEPFRIGYETFGNYWVRRGFPDTLDWSHANGLLYDELDDSLLISLRHQSAVLKIDRTSQKIQWILGDPEGWPKALQDKLLKPEGKMRWPYHQHAPNPTPHGTLLLVDNGNYQANPFKPPVPPYQTYTRAVEYAIDEKNMTVREIWTSEEYGKDSVVSFAMGNVKWLPKTDNILVSYGLVLARDKLKQYTWGSTLSSNSWTRIREYTHTTPPQLIWEVIINGDPKKDGPGWNVFGVKRIPKLNR